MYKEVNNFPALKSDLESAFDVDKALSYSRKDLLRLGSMFKSNLLGRLPDGERGPQGQERPSIRLWGQRLRESFEDPIVSTDRREGHINISVLLDHPSVDSGLGGDVLSWFQHGTDSHMIPSSDTKVVFWWGLPLKWPHHGGKPGVRSSTKSKQWGSSTVPRGYWAKPYGDFEGEAADDIRSEEENAVDKVYATSISRPLDKSRYLRRAS